MKEGLEVGEGAVLFCAVERRSGSDAEREDTLNNSIQYF